MKIPKRFCIAGGKTVNVNIVDTLEDNNYGDYSDIKSEIRLAKQICDIDISEEDLERTFWHEFVHCMNYFYNCECDESLAQTFSNFLYEFMHTKQ